MRVLENQRRYGRSSGAVGRENLPVLLLQKLGSNGVARDRSYHMPGLGQGGEQFRANIFGCGGVGK